jgi:hypothetical protein
VQPNRPGALVALTVLVALVVCAVLLPVQWRLTQPKAKASAPARQAEGSGQPQWAASRGHRVQQGLAKCKRVLTMALRVLRSRFQRVLRTLPARPGRARRLRPTPLPTATAPPLAGAAPTGLPRPKVGR